MLNPNSLGGGIVFSDYYPPGTKLYEIPGVSESKAIAVQQPTGSYLLAVHQNSAPPTNSLVTCYGWVEPTKKHAPGHYKVISGGHVEVGRMIGSIGTDFMSIQIPGGNPVYAISGVNPRRAIAVGYFNGSYVKAIWVPDPLGKSD